MRDGGREEEDGDSGVLSLIKQWLISGVEHHSLASGENHESGTRWSGSQRGSSSCR